MSENTVYTSPARGEGETFEQYKARRNAMNATTKALLKGTLFHDSARYGTYKLSIHNPGKLRLKAARKARGIRK